MAFSLAIILTTAGLSACNSGDQEYGITATAAHDPTDNSNRPPSIIGDPVVTIAVDNEYLFLPAASDPDGDPLSFSILNLPVWAEIDIATGRLSGIPRAGDVGQYSNIVITVNDGEYSRSLAAFAIEVVAAGSLSVTLSWTPPTQNADGSTLTDLAGYKIYYGVSEGNYPNVIIIDNPGIATYVVENLTPATYFFAATAFNSNGIESEFSNIAVKIVG